MNSKSLLTFAATLAFCFNVSLASDDDSPLAKEMKVINKSLRTLKRQSADPAKKDDNLTLLALIKKSLEAAHKLEPAKAKEVPAAEKGAYLEKYHQQMRELSKTFDELEAALKADNQEGVKKAVEKLGEQKEKGHKDFAPDEEE